MSSRSVTLVAGVADLLGNVGDGEIRHFDEIDRPFDPEGPARTPSESFPDGLLDLAREGSGASVPMASAADLTEKPEATMLSEPSARSVRRLHRRA